MKIPTLTKLKESGGFLTHSSPLSGEYPDGTSLKRKKMYVPFNPTNLLLGIYTWEIIEFS